jgi:hypothetical protein
MSDCATSAPMLAFPSCCCVEQLEIAEHFLFGLLPGLTKFIREITEFERAAGITDTHALITKGESYITRTYGLGILLN